MKEIEVQKTIKIFTNNVNWTAFLTRPAKASLGVDLEEMFKKIIAKISLKSLDVFLVASLLLLISISSVIPKYVQVLVRTNTISTEDIKIYSLISFFSPQRERKKEEMRESIDVHKVHFLNANAATWSERPAEQEPGSSRKPVQSGEIPAGPLFPGGEGYAGGLTCKVAKGAPGKAPVTPFAARWSFAGQTALAEAARQEGKARGAKAWRLGRRALADPSGIVVLFVHGQRAGGLHGMAPMPTVFEISEIAHSLGTQDPGQREPGRCRKPDLELKTIQVSQPIREDKILTCQDLGRLFRRRGG
jgi:hypothetical protein